VHTWLEITEFSKLIHLDISTIKEMIKRGDLIAKEENGKEFIEVDKATYSLTPTSKQEVLDEDEKNSLAGADFVEKTIGTILSLHEKVLDAKDETLEALKGENRFLKEALFSMQELYDEDRKTVETLTTQLKHTQEELEFTRRKYKLMWNKAIENYKK
jgi:vacuolar-type H+-ATPase subunit I/STV1